MCVDVVNMYKGKIPILGVCLGHQILGYCAGAIVEKGKMPMHGKVTEIHTCGTGLFARLPESFHVTRYHSLVINGSSLPDDYQVDAISEDGAVMGISHRRLPLYGVQFHPEAVLTEYGHDILYNFCIAAEKFNCR
jgi:anthranilate synthase component 2/para-aminobenzoate synthetase component 2